jgi:hypothetical protein
MARMMVVTMFRKRPVGPFAGGCIDCNHNTATMAASFPHRPLGINKRPRPGLRVKA